MDFHLRNKNLGGRCKQNRLVRFGSLHFTGLLRGPVLSSGKSGKLRVVLLKTESRF